MSQRKTQSNVIPDELSVCPQESAHWVSISSTVKAIEKEEIYSRSFTSTNQRSFSSQRWRSCPDGTASGSYPIIDVY